jgi:hypothetical protein
MPGMTSGTPNSRVDTSVPHSARVYDFLLGGKDNYLVDQEVAEALPPEGRVAALQNRAFMHRAVAYLAERGTDQFLDIGTGIPTAPNLHQIVQGINPKARIVYVDNDPIVLRHAEALLISHPEGGTEYLQADVREPGAILEAARGFLDFGRPVAVSLIGLLHFLPDDEDPRGIIRTFVDALPSGSHLVLTQGAADIDPDLGAEASESYAKGGIRVALRTYAEALRFFDGLDLIPPGLVTASSWVAGEAPADPEPSGLYAGVARIP